MKNSQNSNPQMNIKDIGRCSMFSSDFKGDSLIFTEFDGSIHFNSKNIPETDSYKKFIKFYPPDIQVFTTTGSAGLKVWETEKEKILYSYPRENLFDHSYSDYCILASFDEFNIKFYDLRTRYLFNSLQHPNIKKLDWSGQYLYILDEEQLKIIDYRLNGRKIHSVDKVLDFCICNGNCYYLINKSKKDSEFKEMNELKIDDNNVEVTRKDVTYKTIQSVFDKTKIVGILNDGFKLESQNEIETFHLNGINPIRIHMGEDLGYIFTSTNLYMIKKFDVFRE